MMSRASSCCVVAGLMLFALPAFGQESAAPLPAPQKPEPAALDPQVVIAVQQLLDDPFARPPITPGSASAVEKILDLKTQSYRVGWSTSGSTLAILRWAEPVQLVHATRGRHFPAERLGEQVNHFAFGPQDRRAAFNEGPVVHILQSDGTELSRFEAPEQQPRMTFSPDGKFIATGCYGTAVDLWQVSDGTKVASFPVGPQAGGLTPVFSPDGATLAIGNRNGVTYLYDVKTGAQLQTFDKKSSQQLAFSPDGKLLAVAYVDGSLRIWNPATGLLLRELNGQAKELFTLAWSPSGELLATAGLDGPILLWNRSTFTVKKALPAPERVFCLRFSPEERLLLSAGNTATELWGLPERQEQ